MDSSGARPPFALSLESSLYSEAETMATIGAVKVLCGRTTPLTSYVGSGVMRKVATAITSGNVVSVEASFTGRVTVPRCQIYKA